MILCLWVVLDRPELGAIFEAALAAALPEGARVAEPMVHVAGPYLPAELLRGAPPLPPRIALLSLGTADPRGRLLSPAAEAALAAAPMGPIARGGLSRAEEALSPELSRRLGSCLLLTWTEGPPLAAASLWREGRCRWSLALGDRLVRSDGETVTETRDPRRMVPNDRTEVWRLGLEKLLNEPVSLAADERLALPELFAAALI